jgi:hypothetical protein
MSFSAALSIAPCLQCKKGCGKTKNNKLTKNFIRVCTFIIILQLHLRKEYHLYQGCLPYKQYNNSVVLPDVRKLLFAESSQMPEGIHKKYVALHCILNILDMTLSFYDTVLVLMVYHNFDNCEN